METPGALGRRRLPPSLETFLVEWKLTQGLDGPKDAPSLETFLVEWKL